jgi:hypothetical protein
MSADVRIALNRFTSALERHLELVSTVSEQNDEAIERAYFQLQEAFLSYEELLNTNYGEVLPFEVAED